MPEEIALKVDSEIPAYAGLITISKRGNASVQKEPIKRHKLKWQGDRLKIMQACYHRFWNHETKTTDPVTPLPELPKIQTD